MNLVLDHAPDVDHGRDHGNERQIHGPFSHNPTIHKAPDGTHVIFHIGGGKKSLLWPVLKTASTGQHRTKHTSLGDTAAESGSSSLDRPIPAG